MKKSLNLTTNTQSDAVKTAIRSDYNLVATPRLTVDWNWNRYAVPTATNTPSEDDEGFDIDVFPIDSIVEPLRANKGITKALVGQAVVSEGYIKAKNPKFYVASSDDKFKYWTSPYKTNGSGVFPTHTDAITSARPRVSYDRVVKTNKIVIRFENTWASPKTYEVRVATSVGGQLGGTIGGSNPTIAADGTMTLYYNGTAWVSTRPANLVSTNIATIELRVSAMGPGIKRNGNVMTYKNAGSTVQVPTTGANSSLNVIAIEAHLEADLTSRLISVEDDFDMSEKSQLYPIGTTTSNQASLSLSNYDGIFNRENSSSIYYGLTEANAEFNLEYVYTVEGVKHSVQQFKMYSTSTWASDSEAVTSIELEDYSKYLKEVKPNAIMIENKTVPEIIWRVLDSVGFVDYEIQENDLVNENQVPIFWTTGEETVWEVLDSLSTASQTAIYFDNDGKLQVRTRSAAFKDTGVDWSLLGVKSGTNLPDILDWSPTEDYEANQIDVKYKATSWKINSLGKDSASVVWSPETDTVTLRSAPLTRSIDANSTHIYINQKDAATWLYEGKVQIDGEIIEYSGKQFVYYTYDSTTNSSGVTSYSSGVKNINNVTSQDQYDKLNRLTPIEYRYNNYFTGALAIKSRAIWNSEQNPHGVDLSGWTTKYELRAKSTASAVVNPPGFNQNQQDSTATINTPSPMVDADDTYWAFRGQSGSTGYKTYGTRFKFTDNSSNSTQIAGLCYQLNTGRENGYYVEVRLSAGLSAEQRAVSNEVTVYSRNSGKDTIIAKGEAIGIGADIWYDLDVFHSGTGNNQTISVWINGQKIASGTTNSNTAQPDGGRFGLFARGRSKAIFEYIYAVARSVSEPADNYGFFDLKYGAMRGGAWEKEYVWDLRTRTKKIRKNQWKKETYKHNQYVFDEFGPYVHEIREFEVTYDPNPVRYSYLFNTNTWYSAIIEFTSTPFGAKFTMANIGRNNAVIHGEDNLTYAGSEAPLNQVSVILGQNLDIADEETITRKNKFAIRVRGVIESELSSDWIQSESMAKDLAEWMTNHWSESVDEVEVEIVGNPLIQIGDVVDINYPAKNATPASHNYFVVGAKTQFDNNTIKTNLVLRRRRAARDIS